jgi:hypothetical protein
VDRADLKDLIHRAERTLKEVEKLRGARFCINLEIRHGR